MSQVRLGPNGRKFTSASFAPGQTGLEDHGHLRGTERRISTRNSKVIVSYLRKQLRQRLLQGSIQDEDFSHNYEESLDDTALQVPANAKYGRHNMFSRYTDYGGRLSRVRPDSPEGQRSSEEVVEGRDLSPLRQQAGAQAILPHGVPGGSRGPGLKISEGWAQGDAGAKMPPLAESQTGEHTPTRVEAAKALAPRTVDAAQKGYRSGSPAPSLKSLKSTGSGDSHDGSHDSAQSLTHLPKIRSAVSAGSHRPASALSADEDVRLPVIGKDSKAIVQPTDDETSKSDDGSETMKPDCADGSKGLIISDVTDEAASPLDDTDGCVPPREEVSPVPSQYPLHQDRRTVDGGAEECMNRLMMGHFDVEYPVEKKVIRIFVSSTFSDFEAERTALVSKVYPRLKSYCKERGYEFQVCDPHWGIKEISNDNHTYAQHCLSELRECQRVSKGPNFVSILGQKCGFEPVPATISVDDFEGLITGLQNAKELSLATRRASRVSTVSDAGSLGEFTDNRDRRGSILPTVDERRTSSNDPPKATLAPTLEDGDQHQQQPRVKKASDHRKPQIAEDSIEGGGVFDVDGEQDKQTEKEYDADVTLLRNWFQLDENSLAPCYRLQNISSVFKDVLSNDRQKRQRARNQWFFVHLRLLKIMHRYMKDEDQKRDYCMSVTEKEVENGILNTAQDVHGRVLSFKRFITDLHLHLQDYNARDYINLHPMRPEVDLTSLEKIDDLREGQITEKLKYTDIHEFSTEWHKDGINPTSNRNHSQYLDKFANEFHDSLKVMIDSATSVHDRSSAVPEENTFYWCVTPHVNFVRECIKSFHGCADTLTSIKRYIRNNSEYPLVVHGPTGSGKTSMVAKAADLVRDWTKSEELAVIVRFVGLTSESHHIRKILTDICRQICHIYGLDASSIPEDYFGLMNDLENRFRSASSQRPLVIFIDALDQLSDENNARNLLWLPKNLPEHVHLVVTTVTIEEEQHECFKVLKKVLPESSLLPIPDLSPSDTAFILSHRLGLKNRRLTSEQRSAVVKACEENASPLFVTLAADEAARWNSQTTGRALFLPGTLKKLVNHIIIRMESSYGEPLVRRTLGYITASQNGLSWSELEDLLSLDEAVMNDVVAHNATPLRRLPPALWCRLRAELEQYLSLGVVDGCWTYRWLHREFHECATERYLKQRDKAPSYHSALSEFFMGKWANVKKPFPGNDGGAERFVDPMPLVWNHLSPNGESKPVNNLRKLNELPYHLLHSNQMDKLKTEVLINYEWILAKLKATSLRVVLDDIQSALIIKPNDLELRLMSDTLQLSAGALTKDPNQLGAQLIGRLYNIIASDKPMSVGDPKKYPSVAVMFGTLNRSSVPLLMPSATCLSQPGGVLFDLLAGHTSEITAVTVSSDGNIAGTASTDGTVKMWDLRSRKVLKTLPKMGTEVSIIRFALRNHVLIAVTHHKIHVWDLDKRTLISTMDECIDPPSITIAGDDEQYLCAFFSGINAMRTWELSAGGECSLVAGREIAGQGIHKDQSVCVSINSSGEKVLYAFRSDNKAYVVNAKTGQRLHELKAPGQAASVTALGISKDYYIVVCRYLYMKLSEIHHLELYDIKTGKYERAVRGCTHDVVNELYVNRMGSHALCLCPSAQSNTSHISVWNLETEDHKHMAKHAQMSSMGACVDLSFCLSASKQDKALRIWNISKNVNDREGTDSKSKKREGVSVLVPMINNPRYVVAKSIDNGPLSVWNVLKGKCSGNAVRIERGLVDQHDVFLIRNHKAVILSDRGMSSVSEKPTPVFQTVFMYNLKLKKYYRKLTGVFIVPSPAHEYRLLDGELLLGLSESRDHLICWSLVTGHIKFRVKSKFKELERWRGMRRDEEEALRQRTKRGTSAKMTPWDRRSESHTARQRRRDSEFGEEKKRLEDLRKEKENAIEQYVMSKDEKIIVCCYFAHHMCVFDVENQTHLQTLENESSMLYLYNSALTPTGSFLAHANYDDSAKCSYVTLWDLQSGQVRKRIKNEPNVCCVGINSDATRVFFGKESNILKIWDVRRKSTLRKLRGYTGMKLTMESKIFMIDEGARAIVFANDISLWDLDRGTMVALFTPDIRITCVEVVMGGKLIVLGLRESADLITLKLRGRDIKAMDLISGAGGEELFGETTGDTTDEEEEDEEESEVASNKGSEQSY